MAELWYRNLGFHNNPFSVKPAAFTDEVLGQNLEHVFERVGSGSIVYITGEYGTGKTTLMKQLIRKFGGRRQVVHLTRSTSEDSISTEKILRGKYGFLGNLTKRLPKNMIMLIDEAHEVTNEDSEELMKFYKKGNIKSIVFFGTNYARGSFVSDMDQMLNGNIIRLGELSDEQAVSLIRKRLGSSRMLPDAVIKKIFQRSNKNPRELLENCEDICRLAVNHGATQAGENHVEEFFGRHMPKEPEISIKEPEISIKELAGQIEQATAQTILESEAPNVMLRLEGRPITRQRPIARRSPQTTKPRQRKKRATPRKKQPKYKKQNVKNEIKAEMADDEADY